jgi:predicted solute-binding protein
LYVNERTRDLGREGAKALRTMEELARAAGVVSAEAPQLRIFNPPA